MENVTEIVEAKTEEQTGITLRVFKADEMLENVWHEMPSLFKTGTYFYPMASDFGTAYGPGRFLYFNPDGYGEVKEIVVAQEPSYYEVTEDEA